MTNEGDWVFDPFAGVGTTASAMAYLYTNEKHDHGVHRVYPAPADTAAMAISDLGVAVLGGAANTLGNFVEIIPASTVTSPFDAHFINVLGVSVNSENWELHLYDCSDNEIVRMVWTLSATADKNVKVPIITPMLPANECVKAKIRTVGGGDTATIQLAYHTY